MYGPFTNEQLLGRAHRRPPRRGRPRHQVRHRARPDGPASRGINGTPDYVRAAVRRVACSRLGVDHIDLYYQHRVDPTDADRGDRRARMAELVPPGKVRHLGLSEAAPETIRRAHAVHPITAAAVPSTRCGPATPRTASLAACRELGIGLVAYSPLGRGFLTGADHRRSTTSPPTTSAATTRASRARTSRSNLDLVDEVERARGGEGRHARAARARLGARAGRRRRADPRHQAPRRTSRRTSPPRTSTLTADDLAAIDKLAIGSDVAGTRYAAETMGSLNR